MLAVVLAETCPSGGALGQRPFFAGTVLANVAGLVLVIAGIQIFVVNRRFLPRAVRPPLWREVVLLLCVAFYGFFSWFGLRAVFARLFS